MEGGTSTYLGHGSESIDSKERRHASGQELEGNDTNAPAVGGRRGQGAVHHLGGHVLDGAAHAHPNSPSLIQFSGQAKVNDPQAVVVLLDREDNVEGFEVEVDKVATMDELDAATNLPDDGATLLLGQDVVLGRGPLTQVPSGQELGDQNGLGSGRMVIKVDELQYQACGVGRQGLQGLDLSFQVTALALDILGGVDDL